MLIDYRPALRHRTGVGEFVHQLVTALADSADGGDRTGESVDVTVFSASWKDRLDGVREVLPATVRGIDRRIPVRLLNLAWHRTGWPPVEALTGRRFDVVHSPHPLLMPSRSAARVVTIHDLDFLDNPDRARGEVRRDYPALVRRHARRADRIVVPSRHTAAEVERRLAVSRDTISVCRNGAPTWARRGEAPRPGHLLFVGTLAPRKNVAGLLDAYARLIQRRAEVPQLVLAGADSEDAPPWRKRLERPPLAGRVRCTGYVDRSALEALYGSARVLVLPSFDEGFGLPALEAMTVGVPVVASNRGALPEVVGDAGVLVDPADVEGLVNAMERMLSDEPFVEQCIKRGFEQARAFSWRASAEALRIAYRQAIRTRTRSRAARRAG